MLVTLTTFCYYLLAKLEVYEHEIITLVVVVALCVVSFSNLAIAALVQSPAPIPGNWYCPYYGQYYNNLTDDQKSQIASWQRQRLDQTKLMLQKQVKWGWITQAQADQQISWMEQRFANGYYGYSPMGGGYGCENGGCW